MALFDRQSPGSLRYLTLASWVMSRLSISHQPKLPVVSRHFATVLRRDATILCHLRALLCHFATLLRHFVHVANSDLRRIACDFLTSRIRVGEAESDSFRRATEALRSESRGMSKTERKMVSTVAGVVRMCGSEVEVD